MFKLWEENTPGYNPEIDQNVPSITPYLLSTEQEHGAIIVCPGGGYAMKAPHEGEPIARWLNSIGLSAFVLDYRVTPYKHPFPLMDAQRAVRYVKYYSDHWRIHSDKVGILGFSAGGHLASTVGTHFDEGYKDSSDPIERMSSRPDAMVLCYPVITFGQYRHDGSMQNLIGETPDEELRCFLSNEEHVSEGTPPTFLWHTANDEAVPVENSLMLANALSKYNINFALHIFPEGQHGLGLAEDDYVVSKWTTLCKKWFEKLDFI